MTARLVVSCDGEWNGMPCRGALPTRDVRLPWALKEAREAGWSLHPHGGDLCPAHTRARSLEVAR